MKKITHLLFFIFLSYGLYAQHTFPTDTNVYTVPDASTTITVNINDLANSAGVPAGVYGSYTITADWSISSGDAWSNEARLAIGTTSGTTAPAGSPDGASSTAATTLTFSGNLSGSYDPSVDGTLFLELSRTYSSPADWTNISVTIDAVIPPPVNDDCSSALALTPGAIYDDNPVDGTTEFATESGFTNSCGGTPAFEVWYSVVVPPSGDITIETGPDIATGNTGFDSAIEVYSSSDNTCSGTLSSIGCDDDGASSGLFSLLELTGQTPGNVLFIRVWEFGNDQFEPFSISAYSASLSSDEFATVEFSYYPNPTKDKLYFNSLENIDQLVVFNLLGQEVLRQNPSTINPEINLSNLKSGNYFVKVTIDNRTEIIKIIKE